jgi:hypothetical protein
MKYQQTALIYAEKYGIIEYEVINNTMVYYEAFPLESTTYKAVVNLDTMQESRTPINDH